MSRWGLAEHQKMTSPMLGPQNPEHVFLSVDLPSPGAAHRLGFPMVLRGSCVLHGRPVLKIEVRLNNEPLLCLPQNDRREDVLEMFPEAARFGMPVGFQFYADLPLSEPGTYALDFYAISDDGFRIHGNRVLVELSDQADVQNPFPEGHFYSPVVDPIELKKDEARIWPLTPTVLGVDFRHEAQRKLLLDEFPKYLPDFIYPENPNRNEFEFYQRNPTFGGLDTRALFVLLRSLRPNNMIEVGGGFSSLLAADVNRRFLNHDLNFVCIEPFPRSFFSKPIPGLSKLITQRVQEVPLSTFEILGEGDFLFIDSSHVAKTGSDVNHLIFEVIPRLRPGVIIHFHDVHLPHDYYKERVLSQKLSWNEQYLVRAMLMFSNAFEIVFGSSYAHSHFSQILQDLFDGELYDGASLWIRKLS